jgi:DNA-binding MarR family transcriptional regulator
MSRVGMISNVPATTAERWVKVLECEGLLVRSIDPLDAKRVLVELTLKGTRAMGSYFRGGEG